MSGPCLYFSNAVEETALLDASEAAYFRACCSFQLVDWVKSSQFTGTMVPLGTKVPALTKKWYQPHA